MNDLVERLRDYRPLDLWGDRVHHTICTEAATEIERLRSALRVLRALVKRVDFVLLEVVGELDDEGDRVYLGSTNHVDTLRAAMREIEAATYQIMEEEGD